MNSKIEKPKRTPAPHPSWAPFKVIERGVKVPYTREAETLEGLGDRMRTAAFAEKQAFHSFLWAIETFKEQAPEGLCEAYHTIAYQEEEHMNLLLNRMQELNIPVDDRVVSDSLWISLTSCTSIKEFCIFMASAEDRGRKAGFRFYEELKTRDPISAEIFNKIAKDEVTHIELAFQYFPEDAREQVGKNNPQS